MAINNDINRPTTTDEIANATGRGKRSIERQAEKEGWEFTEEASPGRYKKRIYAIKDLPKDIQFTVLTKRKNNAETSTAIAMANAEKSSELAGKELVKQSVSSEIIVSSDDDIDQTVTETQRDIGQAISVLVRWIDGNRPGLSIAQALRYLNQGYKAGTLEGFLVSALDRCKQKASGVAKTDNILTASTLDKWRKRYKEQGDYIPKIRQKDMTLQAWHIDLAEMLKKNRTKKCTSSMIEVLKEKYGSDVVTEGKVYRWLKEKYSKKEIIKGRHTGMQLRSRQAYQPRTADGMFPWQEVHADGWNTHFTAPHPVTFDPVTYELWDFHDVATRYIPPFGIGLSENYEVIAKGIENAIRDGGVMCILQCDSTRIVKNNLKFTGDMVRSIADNAGFTIVHPKAVGNAQANGIAENWHAWADKQCRVLASYQAKSADSLTLRNVKKITAKMAKAARNGDLELRDKLKAQAAKLGGGLVFEDFNEAIEWIEINLRQKWNNKPHSSLKKVRDPETGKLRHQTPQEAIDEHKANGWKPVMLDEAVLVDIFRDKKDVRVTRGMVCPYGKMLYRNLELGHYEGEKVMVWFDRYDYKEVWVRTLKGELICIAQHLESTGYRSVTAYQDAEYNRYLAQEKNTLRALEMKKAQRVVGDDSVIEGEVLQVVDPLPIERPEPLKRVTDIVGFNEPEVKERQMTREETLAFLYGNDDENQNNGQTAKK